ncbi:MAG: hypothetical protein WCJ37_13445 [Syntrophus sp. (in: bacteria)]
MAIDEIGELHEKIILLDEYSKSLRRESNEIVAFIPDENGQPKQVVTDATRFSEIGKELQSTASERTATMAKLAEVKELLGTNVDGSLAALSGQGYIDQATRHRFRFANELHPLMANYRRALTLAEVQELPEYQRLESETLPEIKRLETLAKQDQALAAQVRAILNS